MTPLLCQECCDSCRALNRLSLGERSKRNKELFENAPSYMIIRPSLRGGLYMSAGQISKLIVKLTCIHVQLLTKPHEFNDKSISHTFAYLQKSIWTWGQILMILVRNTHRDYSKSTGISWQLFFFFLSLISTYFMAQSTQLFVATKRTTSQVFQQVQFC